MKDLIIMKKNIRLMVIDEEKNKKLPENFKIYELISVNAIRKIIGLWDFFFCILHYHLYLNVNFSINFRLMSLQKTQFSFWNKLGLFFNRYSFVNTLKRIK